MCVVHTCSNSDAFYNSYILVLHILWVAKPQVELWNQHLTILVVVTAEKYVAKVTATNVAAEQLGMQILNVALPHGILVCLSELIYNQSISRLAS